MWMKLDADEKAVWKKWEEWDAKRYERDELHFKKIQRKHKSSGESGKGAKSASPDKNSKNENRGTMTGASSSNPKGKRALEGHNDQPSATADLNNFSLHVPKRRKGDV